MLSDCQYKPLTKWMGNWHVTYFEVYNWLDSSFIACISINNQKNSPYVLLQGIIIIEKKINKGVGHDYC